MYNKKTKKAYIEKVMNPEKGKAVSKATGKNKESEFKFFEELERKKNKDLYNISADEMIEFLCSKNVKSYATFTKHLTGVLKYAEDIHLDGSLIQDGDEYTEDYDETVLRLVNTTEAKKRYVSSMVFKDEIFHSPKELVSALNTVIDYRNKFLEAGHDECLSVPDLAKIFISLLYSGVSYEDIATIRYDDIEKIDARYIIKTMGTVYIMPEEFSGYMDKAMNATQYVRHNGKFIKEPREKEFLMKLYDNPKQDYFDTVRKYLSRVTLVYNNNHDTRYSFRHNIITIYGAIYKTKLAGLDKENGIKKVIQMVGKKTYIDQTVEFIWNAWG